MLVSRKLSLKLPISNGKSHGVGKAKSTPVGKINSYFSGNAALGGHFVIRFMGSFTALFIDWYLLTPLVEFIITGGGYGSENFCSSDSAPHSN